MSTAIGYRPGDSWLVAGPSAVVALPGGGAGSAQDALSLWPLVRDRAPTTEVVDAVRSTGAVDWAVAVVEPTTVRVLVRGQFTVVVETTHGSHVVDGRGLITWSERLFDGALAIEIVDPDGGERVGGTLLPVPGGVVRATAARWTLPPGGPTTTATTPAAPEQAITASTTAATERARAADPAPPPAAAPVPDAVGSDRVEPIGPDLPSEAGDPIAPSRPDAEQPAPAPAPEPAVAEPPATDSDAMADGDVDDTVDEAGDDAVTVISMVPRHGEQVVVARRRPAPAVSAAVAGETGSAGRADVTQSVPFDEDLDISRDVSRHVRPEPAAPSDEGSNNEGSNNEGSTGEPGDLPVPSAPTAENDGVATPQAAASPPESGGSLGVVPPATAAVLGDHDGITVLAEDLPAGFTPPPLPPEPPPGWVYASLCPSGHPNQPHAGNCRVCGQPIPPDEPVATPRPLLARLRLSTGAVVDLDRRVVIGRAPTVSRVSSADLPRLIAVPSPLQDVSRSHVEIRAEDWHLVVADLHSTNGTVVRPPDRPEQLLHPGQQMVVETGWLIDLGDGITFVIEAAL